MSLFRFTELPPEKEAEKNAPCSQEQGLLLLLSDGWVLLPLGMLEAQLCIPGCVTRSPECRWNGHCSCSCTTLALPGTQRSFVGLFMIALFLEGG